MMHHQANLRCMKFIKLFSILALSVLLVSCFGERRERQEALKLEREMEKLMRQMEEVEVDDEGPYEEVIEEFIENEYPSEFIEMPDGCIPILADLYNTDVRPLDYLQSHFDSSSIAVKEYYSNEWAGDASEVCGWTQSFTNGMEYSESSCGEAGWSVELKTGCESKISLYHFVNALWGNEGSMWDIDSTHFEPPDGGAGCYFHLKTDNGSYTLSGYCGC